MVGTDLWILTWSWENRAWSLEWSPDTRHCTGLSSGCLNGPLDLWQHRTRPSSQTYTCSQLEERLEPLVLCRDQSKWQPVRSPGNSVGLVAKQCSCCLIGQPGIAFTWLQLAITLPLQALQGIGSSHLSAQHPATCSMWVHYCPVSHGCNILIASVQLSCSLMGT